jgi:hypothetical protein
LNEAGYKFVGLPGVYIIHWDHGVPKWRNKGDLVRVRVWINYFSFLEEIKMKHKTTIPEKWVYERDMRTQEALNFRKLLLLLLSVILFVFFWSIRKHLRLIRPKLKMED